MDKTISQLTAGVPLSTDIIPYVDLATNTTKKALISNLGIPGGGTVTTVAVSTANGFTGTVANATTTPAITLTTSINSPVLAGDGTAISAATTTGSGSTVVLATSPTFQTSINGAYLTAFQILITDGSKNIISADTATYPSLTELSYLKGVTSAIQTQINSKGSGTVTAIGVTTANGVSGSSSGGATPNLTITLGAITPATVNGNTFTTGTYTLTGAASKTLTFNNSLTLAGTDSTTMTFPSTTATIARTDAAQTFTGIQTFAQILTTPATISVSSNAGTVTRSNRINNFTNSSAATMAITLSTTGALDGDMVIVRIYDFSAVAQTIGWTNTEDSTVTAPTTSNGSTTLPLTVGFMYNSATSKWRCIAKA